MSHDALDLTIQVVAIIVPVFCLIIVALMGYAVRETIGRVNDKLGSTQAELTDHKESCERINKAVLAEKVEVHDKEIASLRKFAHWIVECVSRIAGKLDVSLPERPS